MSDSKIRKTPPIVALVLHFRNAGLTLACVEALCGQGVAGAVIVDNSEDNGASLAAIGQQLAACRATGIAIDCVTAPRNLGFAAGVNFGLQYITGRFGAACALLINNDAYLQPGALERLEARMWSCQGEAVIAPAEDGGVSSGIAYYQRLLGLITRRPLPGSFAYLSGCCLLLPPQLAAPPLFDESFFFYGDDIDLGWRLRRNGFRLELVDDAVVRHIGSASSRKGSLFYEYHLVRSHWLLAASLSASSCEKMLMIAGRSLTLPARAGVRSLRQRSLLPWRAFLLATLDLLSGHHRQIRP